MKNFLCRYSAPLHWIHILAILGLIIAFPIFFVRSHFIWQWTPAGLLFLCTWVGFSHNLGLMHEHCHRTPKGPKAATLWLVRFMYGLGGLNFENGCLAHTLHHAFLGTEQDPDRHGYLTTVGLKKRFQYLFFIGPIRARFAPVDISGGIAKMSPKKRKEYERNRKICDLIRFGSHLIMLVVLGVYYIPYFAALLAANICSNVREMAEHGNNGSAAYVHVSVSPLSLLIFSNPGFWYHAHHHMHPQIHYLELPLATKRLRIRNDLPFIPKRSYLKYLFFGV